MELPPPANLVGALAESIAQAEQQLTTLAWIKGLLPNDQEVRLQMLVVMKSPEKNTPCVNPNILKAKIEALGLSRALCDRLEWQGITTVESLVKKDPREIAKHRCCGKNFLHKISEALKRQGLCFEHPIPEHLIWKTEPSDYRQTLDHVTIQTLEEKDWRLIEKVSWKKYQRGIITYIRTIGNRPMTGKKMVHYAEEMYVGTIARCINDQFERAGLPFRLKATTNLDLEDKLKLSWGFQIGVLPKE